MAASIQPPGFGRFQVPEMPAYVQGFSKRGNGFQAETTPVQQQARVGNPRYVGGMDAYLSQVEDRTYFEGYRTKKGNAGVFEIERWGPGYDWRGNYGVASLDASKNFRMFTRGGETRLGGPKRSDYMDRPDAWFERARPGISHGRYTQTNDNYSGVFEYKRNTPFISTDNDPLVLREMIEHNPFHISSHAAAQAKAMYDAEFGTAQDEAFQGYRSDITPADNQSRFPRVLKDDSPMLRVFDRV